MLSGFMVLEQVAPAASIQKGQVLQSRMPSLKGNVGLHNLFFHAPGAARQLVTFSCAAKEKVTKEKAAQVRRS